MQCIVCKQPIEGLHEVTTRGPVHSGQCAVHFHDMEASLNEADSDTLLAETELL